ncbi:hypothetical protein Fmac_011882 [Flemingia macrophylla]|uniref:Uncharacterized protein n=1 Tax=Flemingia macrophylla TaxID=520843 RepID=A0ABD1MNP3_9FABA
MWSSESRLLKSGALHMHCVRQGMLLDHVSLTGVVSACGYTRNLELGSHMHDLAQNVAYGTHVSVRNVLMSIYAKYVVPKDAKAVFMLISNRNVVSWTTVISIDE